MSKHNTPIAAHRLPFRVCTASQHDATPALRFAKGVLSGVVPWRQARRFFACRLKRRLTEEGIIRHISSTDVSISRLDAIKMVSVGAHSRHCQAACVEFSAPALLTAAAASCPCLPHQVRAWSSQAGTGLHDELALSSQAGSDDASALAGTLGGSGGGAAPAVAEAAAAEAAAAADGNTAGLWEAMMQSDK